jgi:hypothetical protein
MMITGLPHRRALSVLDGTESRRSCASGLITSSVDTPIVAIRPPVRSPHAWRLPSRARMGERWARFIALSLRSLVIQSP